jgi:predicted Fe-S protein YdhL (DUF1289 family)
VNNAFDAANIRSTVMGKLLVGVVAGCVALLSTWALADDTTLINEMNMKPLTAAQSAQLRSERDAAKAKWASMTQAQKDAVIQTARTKKLGELTALERIGQNDDMMAMTKTETAQLKAEREAAQAKWATMTPEQKAAVRKAAQQKRAADMNAIERVGQNDDMGRWLSY